MTPPGYKQTEVGVIPEEWEIRTLKQLTLEMLQGVNTAIDKPEYVLDGIPMLKANNVIDGEVVFDGADHISLRTFLGYSDRFRAKKNDFLFSNIGARLGTGSLLRREIECSFAWNVMRIVADTRKIDPEYLSFLINSPKYSQQIRSRQSGSGMGFVPKGVMQGLVVVCPKNLEEQRTIATALSDVDALLAALDRLIAKQRDLKQAAMQQLLTGQTRLPGFTGEWDVVEVKTLYEKVFKKSPLSSADGRTLGDYPLFVSGGEPKRTNIALFKNTEALIISDGGVFNVRYFSGDFSVTDHCFVISLKGDMHFFFQWMSLRKAELDLMTFKGSGLRNLDKPSFAKVNVPVPPLPEQTAIATVLYDMDLELAALEQRRDKTRALKQGMMQELLTGRTRLV